MATTTVKPEPIKKTCWNMIATGPFAGITEAIPFYDTTVYVEKGEVAVDYSLPHIVIALRTYGYEFADPNDEADFIDKY